jgi:hypothetical protein
MDVLNGCWKEDSNASYHDHQTRGEEALKKARLVMILGGVCLISVLSATGFFGPAPVVADRVSDDPPPGIEIGAKPVAPEISFEDGAPLAPNVAPVVILSGSDYVMGYQYARQLYRIFGAAVLEKLQRSSLAEGETAALNVSQAQLAKYAPEFIEMFRGMVAGATSVGVRLSFEEILADYITGLRLPSPSADTEPPESEKEKMPQGDGDRKPSNGCSGFAAWGSATRDGRLIAAGSTDGASAINFIWHVICFPETDNNYIFTCTATVGFGYPHPCMNNRGLAYAHHGAGTSGREERSYGVPEFLQVLHTLRFADNADEALQMQLAYPNRAGGLWADVSGDAFVLECRDPRVIRRAGDHDERDFIYATNSVLDESLEPFLKNHFGWPLVYFKHGGWNLDDMNSVRRDLCIWNALHNYHGKVDMEFAKMLWRFPGKAPNYPTLEEADIKLFENQGKGWDTHIGSLSNGHVGIMLPDDGDGGLYYSCVGAVGRQAEPLTAGYHRYPIAATHTFFELTLASTPADVIGAAKKRAQYDLYYANRELRKLTYADVQYASLDAIFNRAATEFQKGDYYLNLARTTQGNDSVYNHARAARAFTKCQAYAKQVYGSLVPPATTPSDLGLGEWLGPWGEWELAPTGNP